MPLGLDLNQSLAGSFVPKFGDFGGKAEPEV